jgi:hypothetical protein
MDVMESRISEACLAAKNQEAGRCQTTHSNAQPSHRGRVANSASQHLDAVLDGRAHRRAMHQCIEEMLDFQRMGCTIALQEEGLRRVMADRMFAPCRHFGRTHVAGLKQAVGEALFNQPTANMRIHREQIQSLLTISGQSFTGLQDACHIHQPALPVHRSLGKPMDAALHIDFESTQSV